MRNNRAFTLIEMLVSVAVFSLLVVLLLQISGGFASGTQNAKRAMDAASEARGVLDRLGFDLMGMVKSGGVVPEITKSTGNDSIRFLSNVRSAGTDSRLAVVDYEMDTNFSGDPIASNFNSDIKLGRAAVPFTWNEKLGTNLPSTTNKHLVIGESILRFEITLLDENSLPIATPPMDDSTPPKLDLTKISAIVVTIATLDPTSRSKLSTGDLDAINLPDPTNNQDAMALWNEVITSASQPQVVKENLRIFERTYYLQ